MSTTAVAPSPAGPLRRWLWLPLFALAFAPTVAWLWSRWTLSVWYNGHGMFMPLIVAYLVWDQLRDDPVRGEQASPWGFAFLVPGLGMLAMDAAIKSELMAAVGLVVCLPGLSLLLLGAQRTRAIAFPLVIAALMIPIPAGFVAELYLVLRTITAIGTAEVVSWLGIPVMREGTLLHIPSIPVSVADACSGFSTLYAAVTTALILSHLSRGVGKRIVLLTSAVGLALVCNVIRVTALTLIVHYHGVDLLETRLHEGSGLAAFTVVIAGLFAIAGRETLRRGRA